MWPASGPGLSHLRHLLLVSLTLWEQGPFWIGCLCRENFVACAWTSATQLSLIDIFLLSGHCSEERCWLWTDEKYGDDEDSQIRSLKSCQAGPRQPFSPWLTASNAVGLQTHLYHNTANKNICCLANHLSPRYRAAQRRRAGNHTLSTEAHWGGHHPCVFYLYSSCWFVWKGLGV